MFVLQEMVSVAVQKVQDMEDIIKDTNKNDTNGSLPSNGNDPYKHFVRYGFFVFHSKNEFVLFRAYLTLQSSSFSIFLPESSVFVLLLCCLIAT